MPELRVTTGLMVNEEARAFESPDYLPGFQDRQA
jgi:hypothetical protein